MSLFGLGSFGEGFVKGFATEANEALKNDIERINTRVDDLARIKFDRALKDQDERKKELREVEEVLREAGAVFEDDPLAADYAAGLLKKSGSIGAFRQEIAKLRDAKDNQVPLAQFIARASVDSPSGTYMDYANAYVNSRRTLPDVKVPDSASTAGNLIGSIFGKDKVDISGRVESQVGDQMAAAGITPSTAQKTSAFLAPDISYDREGLSMYQMSPSQRIQYIREELARPQNTDDRTSELKDMLNSNLEAAKEDGQLQDQLAALNTQLNLATTDADRVRLQEEVLVVTRQIETNAAITPKDKLAVQIKHATEDSDGSPEAVSNIMNLTDKLEDMTSPLTISKAIEREQRDLEAKVAAGENIPDYAGKLAALQAKRDKLAEIGGTNVLDFADLTAAENAVSNTIRNFLRQDPLAAEFDTETLPDGTTAPVMPSGITEDRKEEIIVAFTRARNNAFNSYRATLEARGNTKSIMALDYVQAMYENQFGEIPAPAAPAATENLVIGDTTVNADTVSAFAESAGVDVDTATASITTMITKHNPNNMEDATNPIYVNGALADKEQVTAVIDAMEDTGIYSPEWIAAARKANSAKTSEPTISIDENVTKAADAISSLSKLAGDRFKENAIMENVGVSREEAKELLVLANAELNRRKEQKLKDTPTEELNVRELLANVRSASNEEEYAEAVAAYAKKSGRKEDYVRRMNPFKGQNKAKGGLMSRGY